MVGIALGAWSPGRLRRRMARGQHQRRGEAKRRPFDTDPPCPPSAGSAGKTSIGRLAAFGGAPKGPATELGRLRRRGDAMGLMSYCGNSKWYYGQRPSNSSRFTSFIRRSQEMAGRGQNPVFVFTVTLESATGNAIRRGLWFGGKHAIRTRIARRRRVRRASKVREAHRALKWLCRTRRRRAVLLRWPLAMRRRRRPASRSGGPIRSVLRKGN
jgi:hypothetical protein